MVKVSFRCDRCNTGLEWEDIGLTDSIPIMCKNCGLFAGTYKDLCDAARAGVIDALFKDSKNSG